MEEQKEDILPIKGFDGYFVSRDGKIFSNKKGELREVVPFVVEISNSLVYRRVILYKNGRKRTKMVHRVVYETFSGVSLGSRDKIYFKDFNTLNCSYDNLTTNPPLYELEEGEEWIDGFEGRYTIYKGEVFSVWQRDFPKRLKPYIDSRAKKYTLYDSSGNPFSFYLYDKTYDK